MEKYETFKISSVVREKNPSHKQVITDHFVKGSVPNKVVMPLSKIKAIVSSQPDASFVSKNGLAYAITFDVIGRIHAEKHKGYISQGSWFRKLGGDTSKLGALFDALMATELGSYIVAFTGDFIIVRSGLFDVILKYVFIGTAEDKLVYPCHYIVRDVAQKTGSINLNPEGDAFCFIRTKGENPSLFRPMTFVVEKGKCKLVDQEGKTAKVEIDHGLSNLSTVVIADGRLYDEDLHYYNLNSSKFIKFYMNMVESKTRVVPITDFNATPKDDEGRKSLYYIRNSSEVTVYQLVTPESEAYDDALELSWEELSDEWKSFFTA